MSSTIRDKTCHKKNYLTSKKCCVCAVEALDTHLSIPIQGRLSQKDIFQVIIGMAAMRQSIHSISTTLDDAPCETSIRYHLKKIDMVELERLNMALLTHCLYKVLTPGKSYQFAIDFTHDPYYGSVDSSNQDYITRNKLKKSTNEFYSYVSLYVITKDHQMTLAVFPVKQGISKVGYVAQCLDKIPELGLKIETLCLDREFYTRRIFEFLQTIRIPYIIPVRKHGRRMKELLQGSKSRSGVYSMSGKPTLILNLAILVKYQKGKGGKHGVENLGYVVNGLKWSPRHVHKVYRSRFAIESSYRMRNLVKPRTTTKNPVTRYFYAIIAFLLKNVWIALLWQYFSPIKQGPRTIDMRVFRFERFRLLIWEHVRSVRSISTRIVALRDPV